MGIVGVDDSGPPGSDLQNRIWENPRYFYRIYIYGYSNYWFTLENNINTNMFDIREDGNY